MTIQQIVDIVYIIYAIGVATFIIFYARKIAKQKGE